MSPNKPQWSKGPTETVRGSWYRRIRGKTGTSSLRKQHKRQRLSDRLSRWTQTKAGLCAIKRNSEAGVVVSRQVRAGKNGREASGATEAARLFLLLAGQDTAEGGGAVEEAEGDFFGLAGAQRDVLFPIGIGTVGASAQVVGILL